MTHKEPEEIALELVDINKKLEKLKKLKYEIESKRHKCCSDICATFSSELNLIESKMIEIDKAAYKKFPLFVTYFAKTKLKKGMTIKDYTEAVFKNKNDREIYINHFYKQTKAKEILNKRDEINNIILQLRLNNICECI